MKINIIIIYFNICILLTYSYIAVYDVITINNNYIFEVTLDRAEYVNNNNQYSLLSSLLRVIAKREIGPINRGRPTRSEVPFRPLAPVME